MKAKRKPAKRRKHNPEMLRMKRVARNLGIPWSDVCRSRDMLREAELEARAPMDEVRRVAWGLVAGGAAEPFWRGAFQRKFGKMLRDGGDCDQVKNWDETCQELRSICPQVGELDSGEIWELVCSDYVPLRPIEEHYRNAVALLTRDVLTAEVPF